MRTHSMNAGVERITELADQGHDLLTFWRATNEVIERNVPHYFKPCYYTMDPASLLATSHFADGIPEIPHEWLAIEYVQRDYNQIPDVARSPGGISTLHEAAGEHVHSCKHYRNLREWGAEQEVRCALRTTSGQVWGLVSLFRDSGMPEFTADELAFIKAVSTPLAEGARRALLIGEATDPDRPDAPGLVVLREDWSVESITPGVERWLEDLPDGNWTEANKLPTAVLTVAGQARRTASDHETPGDVAFARVLSGSGRWVFLHGASMVSAGPGRVAVIVEPAHPAQLTPLLMDAYGLSDREQEVTRLVLQGASTTEIADTLVVSPHTVQDHLKRIFEKTGVRSRRDLIGKVFFSFYEPRLRDNEIRAAHHKAARGGPLTQPGRST